MNDRGLYLLSTDGTPLQPYSDAVASQVVAVVWLPNLLLQQCEHSVSRRSYTCHSWVCVDLHGMVEVCV